MRKLILGALLLLSTVSFGQWTYKTIDNGFDKPFKKAYTETNNRGFLSMEENGYSLKPDWDKIETLIKTENKCDACSSYLVKNDSILMAEVYARRWIYEDSNMNKTKFSTSYTDKKIYVLKYSNYKKMFLVWIPEYNETGWVSIINIYADDKELLIKMLSENVYLEDKAKNHSLNYIKCFDKFLLCEKYNDSIKKENENIINLNKIFVKNLPILYLQGSYFCDDNILVDIVFTVNGKNKNYKVDATKSNDSKTLFFEEDVFNNLEFLNDFKSASSVKLRINESHCEDEYYQLNMVGSTKAFDFLSK